jgi:hypothetical protein
MRSPDMVKAFERFRLIVSKYIDSGIAGCDYEAGAANIAKGSWATGRSASSPPSR